tara:strand:+ start:64 stop:480 length:417 start_codon:yes stop_codon:yes gene_type:complete
MLFHGMAEKIDDKFYKENKDQVLEIIKIICDNLPCPYCRKNASKYIKNNMKNINTKEKFKHFLYVFHNDVNKKLKKKHFEKSILNKYKTINILTAYKWFNDKFYGEYIVSHDFNKWRRNMVKDKVTNFFKDNWKKMFK